MTIALGTSVRIDSVESCARELPEEDQQWLRGLVGQLRKVVNVDRHGFMWLSFDSESPTADFCLQPNEVSIEP